MVGKIDERLQSRREAHPMLRSACKRQSERRETVFLENRWHLTTGHILDIAGENWICLSPACDLVPGQGNKRFEVFGNRRPFVAVKLFPIDDKPLRKIKVQSNIHVFLLVDGETKIFAFTDKGNEEAAPVWRTFYVEMHSVFHDDSR